MIVGFIIYWMGGERLENEMLQLHQNQIAQRAANIDDQFSYLENSLAHWAFDPKFNSSLKDVNFFKDFEIARDVTKTLGIMQGSSPLAKQVELFLNGTEPIRFYPEYDVISDREFMDSYIEMLSHGKLVFWSSNMPSDANVTSEKQLTLVHKLPGVNFEPFGALMVRVNKDKASDLLKTLTPYNVGETLLMQSDGSILLSSAGSPQPSGFNEALRNEVLQRNLRSGSFLYDWNKATYTVSYGTFSRVGSDWFYVSASPISAITKPVVFISKLIISVSCTALLLAVLLSWLASQQIYSPIDRLVRMLGANKLFVGHPGEQDEFKMIEKEWLHLSRESTTLQNKLEQQLPHIKEGFLLQLVQGFLYAYSEEDLLKRMRNFDWEVDGRQFVMMHIQLTGFENLEGRFSQGDEGLVTFAAANIIEELAAGRLEQANAINFHDLSMGLLVLLPEEEPYAEKLHALSEELMHTINHILKLRVSIAIGKPASSISQIPFRYEEAMQALSYRNFENENQMIDLETMETIEEIKELWYPFVLEREIIQLIRTGQEQEAGYRIELFLQELKERGAKEIDIQQGMLQLLGTILHAIRHSGMDPNRVYKSANLYEQLTSFREPLKMLNWFKGKVIGPFVKELEARSDGQVKKAVESAMIYLQNQYMNEISLESCANHTGMNAVSLSKAFKQVNGKNFIDYLTELRMDKAKELLRDTELKINDVAVHVGYQHSYFNRIFKKHEGVTPSLYREQSRH
ncbi:helix-turn-helix domain-containing protein [Paenibacillus agricola]|nr:helix-turn-helix domain-containing protein [Paenibacillus agricola]